VESKEEDSGTNLLATRVSSQFVMFPFLLDDVHGAVVELVEVFVVLSEKSSSRVISLFASECMGQNWW